MDLPIANVVRWLRDSSQEPELTDAVLAPSALGTSPSRLFLTAQRDEARPVLRFGTTIGKALGCCGRPCPGKPRLTLTAKLGRDR